jgi:hypothetical protein
MGCHRSSCAGSFIARRTEGQCHNIENFGQAASEIGNLHTFQAPLSENNEIVGQLTSVHNDDGSYSQTFTYRLS